MSKILNIVEYIITCMTWASRIEHSMLLFCRRDFVLQKAVHHKMSDFYFRLNCISKVRSSGGAPGVAWADTLYHIYGSTESIT